MSGFMGGSAFTMSRDIAGGFVHVSERTFRGMSAGDLNKLAHEIDRHLRELRGSQVATDERTVVQERSRKIQRLNSALTVLRAYRVKQKR